MSAKTTGVKVVELFGMSALTGMWECSENHSAITLQLGGCTESSALPYILSQSSKGCTGFGNPVVDLLTVCCPGR